MSAGDAKTNCRSPYHKGKFKWEPWRNVERKRVGAAIYVHAPPCKHCLWWKPVVVQGPVARCCHAQEQYNDFSCYEPKKDPTSEDAGPSS